MMFDGYLINLGEIDKSILTELQEQCMKMNWNVIGKFQTIPPHRVDNLIVYPFIPKVPNMSYSNTQQKFIDICDPITQKMLELYPNTCVLRALLSTLEPGVEVSWHVDNQWVHKYSHRLHIPIITDDNCSHNWNDHTDTMKYGYIYEINNIRRHNVVNHSKSLRIHLIYDLCPVEVWNSRISEGKYWDEVVSSR